LLLPHLVFQPNWGRGDLGFFQLLQSNSSPEEVWNLGGYIEPHMKITEPNCWVLLDPEGGKTVSWSTWSYVNSSNSCWPYNLKCRRNPFAGYTVPRCEASRGGCCHHRNFLLPVVAPCSSACKLLVCPSKLMRSDLPWSAPLCHPFSVSVFLVQSRGACLFC